MKAFIHELKENWGDWMLGLAISGALLNTAYPLLGSPSLNRSILMVLTILAVDRIVERRKMFSAIKLQLDQLIARDTFVCLSERVESQSLRDFLFAPERHTDCIRCVGMSLYGFFIRHEGLLRECLDRGVRLEFLISTPQKGFNVTSLRGFFDSKAPYGHAQGETIRTVQRLRQYQMQQGTSGSITLRVTSAPLFHSSLTINPSKPNAIIRVLLHLHAVERDRLPMLIIRKSDKDDVFAAFLSELGTLWSSSEEHPSLTSVPTPRGS